MIGRDMVVEAEIIEQPRRRSLKAHHRHLSRIRQDSESRPSLHINPTLTFSTISARLRRSRPNQVLGDGLLALFGMRDQPDVACRHAIAASAAIAARVESLNSALGH